MNKLKHTIIVAFAVILCAVFGSCKDNSTLIGTWKYVSTGDGNKLRSTFVFNDDGTGKVTSGWDGEARKESNYDWTYDEKDKTINIFLQGAEEHKEMKVLLLTSQKLIVREGDKEVTLKKE